MKGLCRVQRDDAARPAAVVGVVASTARFHKQQTRMKRAVAGGSHCVIPSNLSVIAAPDCEYSNTSLSLSASTEKPQAPSNVGETLSEAESGVVRVGVVTQTHVKWIADAIPGSGRSKRNFSYFSFQRGVGGFCLPSPIGQ